MGRMSDARKRARQKAAGAGGPAEPERPAKGAGAVPPPFEPALPDAAVPAAEAELATPRGSEEDAFTFPAEPVADPSGGGSIARFELPSSGLAADILGLHGAAMFAAEAAPPEPAPLPVPAEAAPRGQSVSFFSAPAREARSAVEETEHLATFFLDREEYGVDVRLVQEIRRVTEITQVPRAPEFIKGVINLRGRIIPVIDLKRKLGLGEVKEGNLSRIVVVTIKGRLLGLVVDGASQVLKVPISVIEPPPEEVMQKGGAYLRGVAKLEKRLIILVDLETILAVELREGESAPA